ncbi:hypothetical protein BJX66DRAFT_319547 [Aspergillus keveii]|uniref:Xylanolytic transcriptional activator regulatory domain-containing protein n=1 Tax=Aspergillus keveii TaxID=714993 RepID=A0ABR4FI32_9EURO
MDLPCAVDRNGDRRKAGSRRHVETLEQRIMDLEGLLHRTVQDHQQSETSSSEGAVPVSSAVCAHQNASTAVAVFGPYDLQPSTADLTLAERLLASEGNGTRATTLTTPTMAVPNARSCASLGDKGTGQGFSALSPTSQYHGRSSTESRSQPESHRASCAKTDELADLGIAVSTNTFQVKCRLLQSFFRYQPLWVNAVDEELFWDYREKPEPSMWYSGFLEAVMLASAARLSNSSAVRSLGEQYAVQAKAEIWQALENPSAASVQGFLMLSEYEISHGRERMGWQLCGMACRLLSDLGLHEPHDFSGTTHSIHIQSARLHLLGACISLEGIWCMYLGRPSSIPRSILRTAATSCTKYQGPESSTLSTWVGLCGPMADICEVLNTSRPLTVEAKIILAQLNENLHSWLETLPPGLIYDEPNAADLEPAAYAIHMQFCKIQILVLQASATTPETSTSARTINNNNDQIYTSSLRIIRLLLIYRQIHGTERIRSVMLDTVNLAVATLTEQYIANPGLMESRKRDIRWLRLAFENMVDIQPQFPIIGRVLGSLVAVSGGTGLESVFRNVVGGKTSTVSDLSPACEAEHAVVGTGLDAVNASVSMGVGVGVEAGNDLGPTTGQFPVDELDLIGRSLMSWSNPPIESFWGFAARPLAVDRCGL